MGGEGDDGRGGEEREERRGICCLLSFTPNWLSLLELGSTLLIFPHRRGLGRVAGPLPEYPHGGGDHEFLT